MSLLPCAHIRKSYIEKSPRSANLATRDVHGSPHWNLSFNFFFPPPKTGSREEAGRRKRRLGRIDPFSRGEHTEPFPGWQQAGGAAHAGEQGGGGPIPLPSAPARPPPPSTMKPGSRPALHSRLPFFPPLFGAPQV